MAEITKLTSMEIGAANVYTEQESQSSGPRRVGPSGHIPDPFLTPVGDFSWLMFLAFLAIYLFRRTRLLRRS